MVHNVVSSTQMKSGQTIDWIRPGCSALAPALENAVVRNQGTRDQTLCKGHLKSCENLSDCCGIVEKHTEAFHDSEEGCQAGTFHL